MAKIQHISLAGWQPSRPLLLQGRKYERGRGGGRLVNPISTEEQIMPTTLLLVPRIFRSPMALLLLYTLLLWSDSLRWYYSNYSDYTEGSGDLRPRRRNFKFNNLVMSWANLNYDEVWILNIKYKLIFFDFFWYSKLTKQHLVFDQ